MPWRIRVSGSKRKYKTKAQAKKAAKRARKQGRKVHGPWHVK